MNAAYLVSLLPLLACPLGMGLMLWLMIHTKKHQTPPETRDAGVPSGVAGARPADRLGVLRAHLRDVAAQQAALAAQLEQRGDEAGPPMSTDVRDVAALTR